MSNKFFVYGTLKEGGYFAKQFNKLRISSKVATLEGFDLFKIGGGYNSWFPGIVKGNGTVIGELHEYDKDFAAYILTQMDMIEGYNIKSPKTSFYRREKTTVELEDGSKETAIVYIFNAEIPDTYPKVKSGVWPV